MKPDACNNKQTKKAARYISHGKNKNNKITGDIIRYDKQTETGGGIRRGIGEEICLRAETRRVRQ